MFDEELEDEELDADEPEDISLDDVAEVEENEPSVADSSDDEDDEGYSGDSKRKAAPLEVDMPSLEAKQKERDALAKAMEEFLARGGKIKEITDVEE